MIRAGPPQNTAGGRKRKRYLLLELLRQENVTPSLIEGIEEYRARYPASPEQQARIPHPRYPY